MLLLAGHGLELSTLFGLLCFLAAEQYSTTGKFLVSCVITSNSIPYSFKVSYVVQKFHESLQISKC